MRPARALGSPAVPLGEDRDQVRRRLQIGLVGVGAQGRQGVESFLRRGRIELRFGLLGRDAE